MGLTPRKHPKNFIKPIHGLKKHEKPLQTLKSTQNQKSSQA